MKNTVYILFLLAFLSGCVYDYIPMINIENKSNSKIYVYKSCCDSLRNTDIIRTFDTITCENKEVYYDAGIEPDSIGFFPIPEKKLCTKIWFYFFDAEIIKTKNWKEIVENQLYVKKTQYSKKQLKKSEWHIIYE